MFRRYRIHQNNYATLPAEGLHKSWLLPSISCFYISCGSTKFCFFLINAQLLLLITRSWIPASFTLSAYPTMTFCSLSLMKAPVAMVCCWTMGGLYITPSPISSSSLHSPINIHICPLSFLTPSHRRIKCCQLPRFERMDWSVCSCISRHRKSMHLISHSGACDPLTSTSIP